MRMDCCSLLCSHLLATLLAYNSHTLTQYLPVITYHDLRFMALHFVPSRSLSSVDSMHLLLLSQVHGMNSIKPIQILQYKRVDLQFKISVTSLDLENMSRKNTRRPSYQELRDKEHRVCKSKPKRFQVKQCAGLAQSEAVEEKESDLNDFKRNLHVLEGELLHTKSVLHRTKQRELKHQEAVPQLLEMAQQREELLMLEIDNLRHHKSSTEDSLEKQLSEVRKDAANLREELARANNAYAKVMANSNSFVTSLDAACQLYQRAGKSHEATIETPRQDRTYQLNQLISRNNEALASLSGAQETFKNEFTERMQQISELIKVHTALRESSSSEIKRLTEENSTLRNSL